MDTWPEGVQRQVFDTLDSTNSEAARQVAGGQLQAPLWILAKQQTRGVGRRGRVWASPKGNFSASVVFPLTVPLRTAALYSFVAANALYETCRGVLGADADLSLKWPNDVLLQDRKLAGILLETLGAGPSHLCIGIGVNLNDAPSADVLEQGSLAPVRLADFSDDPIAPASFLARLAQAFATEAQSFETLGFAPTRTKWLSRAARQGKVITAHTGKVRLRGVFETVDADGALVLQTLDGRHKITAADIYFDETGG